MSGIYVGMAVAGFGATMASWTGWRMTFALFGLIGVAYAVILILFLKDPSKAPADTAQAKKPSVPEKKTVLLNVDNDEQAIKEPSSKLSTGAVLSSLLSGRPMWMLLAVVAFAGAGNWFLLTWYPTLLQDKYQLSSAEAGPAATLWSSVAKYVAVLGGAILADMWYRRNARARALVPGITFWVGTALRTRLDRPRPYDQPGFTPLVQKDTHGRSFPSRHALSAAVLAMVWLYFYPAVGWCMIVIALLIAVVRVLTGVHHIRDVAAGLALGFACGFVGMWLL